MANPETDADKSLAAIKECKDRELYESELHRFVRAVRFRTPIPDNLMHFVADTLEQLMSGKNVVKVSDVLGSNPKGSRGKRTLEKERQHKKIAQTFALNKLEGMSRDDNIADVAEECGVTTRTIENVIRDYACTQPFFNYGADENI